MSPTLLDGSPPSADAPAIPDDATIALDLGSTVVKLAWLDASGALAGQLFFPRDYDAGLDTQVRSILATYGLDPQSRRVLACSSANGGLRVGIVALGRHYSGAAVRNQVLLAGANPVYVRALDDESVETRRVDALIVVGGIDDPDAAPMARRLDAFDPAALPHGALLYAGNLHLARGFVKRFPHAIVVGNPIAESLAGRVGDVFETLRRAYLDDLVFKEGVSELPASIASVIRPTPEVASRGFLRSVAGQSDFAIVGTCLVLDIGGATTDLHYTVELIDDDSPERPSPGVSVARYVFTDLGVFASRDTLLLQLRMHPKLHEFLAAMRGGDVRDLYVALRDGDGEPDALVMCYGCLFLALDRFASGRGPGLPTARMERLQQLILTGGAAQGLDETVVGRIVALVAAQASPPLVQIDRRYGIWVAGISWTGEAMR